MLLKKESPEQRQSPRQFCNGPLIAKWCITDVGLLQNGGALNEARELCDRDEARALAIL